MHPPRGEQAGQAARRQATPRVPAAREYQANNVLVEVVGGGKRVARRTMPTSCRPGQRELRPGQGAARQDPRRCPKVYVKVYAMTGRRAKFYKDGYTDLRGRSTTPR